MAAHFEYQGFKGVENMGGFAPHWGGGSSKFDGVA